MAIGPGGRFWPEPRWRRPLFTEDGYTTTTRAAKSEWRYEQIQCICQTSDYLILLLDANHAQVFDKHGFLAGNAEQLTALLMQKTGKDITSV